MDLYLLSHLETNKMTGKVSGKELKGLRNTNFVLLMRLGQQTLGDDLASVHFVSIRVNQFVTTSEASLIVKEKEHLRTR